MTFLNSIFLWGLTAVSIPIIIHLLSQKKPRIIYFSDLRFLELAASRSVKKFRIRQYLLLLIRCLLLIILTFIFARPVIHLILSSKNTETIFLIDNSYSMEYYKDGQMRFEYAKSVVKQTLNLINPQEKIAIFSFSDTVLPVVKNPTTDKSLIISEIEKIKIEYKKTDILNAVNEVIKYFQNDKTEKRIIIVTDFAKNGWLLKKNTIAINLPKAYKIICVDVGDNNPKNFAVSNVETFGNKITAVVSNYSDDKRSISIELYIDGKKHKSAFFEIYPHKSSEWSFNVKNIKNGIHKCFIEIEPDKLSTDNKYFFAFNYREKSKALLIDGNPHFSDFKGETFFLKTALADYSDVKVINFSQFENEKTSSYSVLFFCNVSDFNKDEVLLLKNIIPSGKYLIFFPGDKVSPEKYNTKMSFLLPCEISSLLNYGKLSDYNLPEKLEMSTDENIKERFLLIPKHSSETLLKFSDETPFLVKGKNNVFVFAISSNLSYSDIPIRPVFPIIIKHLFSYFLENDTLIKSANIGETYQKMAGEIIPEIVFPDGKIVKNQNELLFGKEGVYEIKNHKTEFVNVNLDVKSGESDLTKIDTAEIKKLFGKMFVGVVIADSHFEKKIKKILYGNEITKYFILLLLIFAILETLFANYRKL
ncbi:MAG: BatA and WFA domain-containing protein [Elusimicrobiota bacterium]|nr:BatA and WFA domain-containing protein [Elusimicrobiota bacterium]